MNKIPMSQTMVSPNITPKEKRDQGVLEKQAARSERNFDALLARQEEFVTPDGRTGTTLIFSRATPSQLLARDAGSRLGSGPLAKQLIAQNVNRLKIDPDKKQQLLGLMQVKIKGQFSASSNTHLGVEAVLNAGRHTKIDDLPVAKQVRFVDAANSNISARPPVTVELPPLPPDD
ncbi:MAG: hypothetical protein RL404_1693 [Pseudomonadota bacterium]